MQQILIGIYENGPDWPEWANANHWRKDADWREPFKYGDSWATRMDGAVYMISWNADAWVLYRYLGEPSLHQKNTRIDEQFFWLEYSTSRYRYMEESMRWVMNHLPSKVILSSL